MASRVRAQATFRRPGMEKQRQDRRRRKQRRMVVGREQMLHQTHITEKHSRAVILSNVPRFGYEREMAWRAEHPGQHVKSLARLARPATASTLRPWLGLVGSTPPRGSAHGGYGGTGQPRRRPNTAPAQRPRSASARVGSASAAEQEDHAARLTNAGAMQLGAEERKQREITFILGAVHRAVSSAQMLFGNSIGTLEEAFDAVDRDQSGSIDRFEFRRAMRRLGLGLSSAQVEHLLDAVDEDGSGDISFDEFKAALTPPQPEEEVAKEQVADAAMTMLRQIESAEEPWSHERPWREALQPPPHAPIDRVCIVGTDGTVLHDRCGGTTAAETTRDLSRAERTSRASQAARFASTPAQPLLLRVERHNGEVTLGVNSVAEGRCYFAPERGGCWRLALRGAATPGITTRRSDGSRPPRTVLREWMKGRGWCFNKLAREWFKDLPLAGPDEVDDGSGSMGIKGSLYGEGVLRSGDGGGDDDDDEVTPCAPCVHDSSTPKTTSLLVQRCIAQLRVIAEREGLQLNVAPH
jgi:hypothetical protein